VGNTCNCPAVHVPFACMVLERVGLACSSWVGHTFTCYGIPNSSPLFMITLLQVYFDQA